MDNHTRFYVGGTWREPESSDVAHVINPATERPIATVALGNRSDIDAAVASANAAFDAYSGWSRSERLDLLAAIIDCYKGRMDDLGDRMSTEMGAPVVMARRMQAGAGLLQLKSFVRALEDFEFEQQIGSSLVVHEPIGVCGLITPWNWPINQIVSKVGAALAAGCTMVLKPSEIAPTSALLLAQILHDAGVPSGVFNMVNGLGPVAGAALAEHPDVAMVSFTGSTRAGVEVSRTAAATIKRVSLELGGKSANIILDDAEMAVAIPGGVLALCHNSGQSCNAPSRMLVPHALMSEAAALAATAADDIVVGRPEDPETSIGPVASAAQFAKVQGLIESAIHEGARLEAGGLGRPEGLDTGYYVRPTVFSHVTNDMRIAREEVFGPVLVLMGYEDDDDAVRIANDSVYGLSGYVWGSPRRARDIARRIRTGNVHINGTPADFAAPFGGYKQSGNGRERGAFGISEYLETKAIIDS